MSLLAGDLTTPQRISIWGTVSANQLQILTQLIESCSRIITSRLNRARLYSQTFNRVFDGTGTNQILLPDYPLTKINSVYINSAAIPFSIFPVPGQPTSNPYYGVRAPYWLGNLPGDSSMLEFINGIFWTGCQNIQVNYNAGYLISQEPGSITDAAQFTITVQQPQGIWARDNGVVYASTGIDLSPVAASPTLGQYIPPQDNNLGTYTFSEEDNGNNVLISYSFIPADLEEACNQLVMERYSYRSRIGVDSKSLGGQETMHFVRGGTRGSRWPDLPIEVEGMIWPYVSVIAPVIGAPL